MRLNYGRSKLRIYMNTNIFLHIFKHFMKVSWILCYGLIEILLTRHNQLLCLYLESYLHSIDFSCWNWLLYIGFLHNRKSQKPHLACKPITAHVFLHLTATLLPGFGTCWIMKGKSNLNQSSLCDALKRDGFRKSVILKLNDRI